MLQTVRRTGEKAEVLRLPLVLLLQANLIRRRRSLRRGISHVPCPLTMSLRTPSTGFLKFNFKKLRNDRARLCRGRFSHQKDHCTAFSRSTTFTHVAPTIHIPPSDPSENIRPPSADKINIPKLDLLVLMVLVVLPSGEKKAGSAGKTNHKRL